MKYTDNFKWQVPELSDAGSIENVTQVFESVDKSLKQVKDNVDEQSGAINALISTVPKRLSVLDEQVGTYNEDGTKFTGGEIYKELENKQNKLSAGNGIIIENDVISSTGGGGGGGSVIVDQTYKPESVNPQSGKAVAEVEKYLLHEIGLTRTVLDNKQDKLTAGNNITIDENGVISATGGGGSGGKDGVSPTVEVTETANGHNVSITDVNGTKSFEVQNGKDGEDGYTPKKNVDYFDGKDGSDGKDGKDGISVTVSKVTESTTDGGSNVVTFSDGKTVTIKNGSKGTRGDKGDKGNPYTLTDADKAEIVQMVIESLGGNPIFGYVDENNNIIVSGNLADGSYSVKYETENETIDIGDLVIGEDEEEIINQLPICVNADKTPFVGANGEKGYKTNTRLSASSGGESTSSATGLETTGYIPIKYNDTVYLKGITLEENTSQTMLMLFYDSDFKYLANSACYPATVFGTTNGEVVSAKMNSTDLNNSNVTTEVGYMRICAKEINSNSIITVNQPIE